MQKQFRTQHNIDAIKTSNNHKHNTNTEERKFRVNSVNIEKYKENIHRTVEKIIWERSKENGEIDMDIRHYERIIKVINTEKQIEDFSEAMRIACEQSFKTKKARKAPQNNKSVPWWIHKITAARKEEVSENKKQRTKRR